jgi:hypothetical protein
MDTLLATPTDRPNSFEAIHVDAIRGELQEIRDATAGDQLMFRPPPHRRPVHPPVRHRRLRPTMPE